MTKKEMQAEINKKAMIGMDLWNESVVVESRERLNYCNAFILHLDNHCIALQSYGTLVALFDEDSGYLYDLLRYTYGYTSTSAQHIAKFRNMLRGRIHGEFRYYPI